MRHIILALLLIPAGVLGNSHIAACLVECASAEVGVAEEGGNNRGLRVEQFLRSVDFQAGASWCAAFMHFIYWQCGIHLTPRRAYAWSPTWFIERWLVQDPQPGDVIGIYYRNLGRIGHVGMVEGIHDSYVITIEGNTGADGGRDGDGVYRKRRLRRAIHSWSRPRP